MEALSNCARSPHRISRRSSLPPAIRLYGNNIRKATATQEKSFSVFLMAQFNRKAPLPSLNGSREQSSAAHDIGISARPNARWRLAGLFCSAHFGEDRTIVS